MAKADSMLNILLLLGRGRKVTAPELASKLEVSVRTVYRYIDSLSASGVPILSEAGPNGGFSLPESFQRTPLFFTPEQVIALFQAGLLAQGAHPPYRKALEAALGRLHHHLPTDHAAAVDRHTAGLVVVPPSDAGEAHRWLERLEPCVADRVSVELHYQKPGADQPEVRVVDPYALVYAAGRWYLHGHCHLRGARREFRLDRVRGVRRTEASFAPPTAVEVAAWHDDGWVHTQARTGPFTTVRIYGDPRAVASLCEHWYFRHCVTEQRESEATLEVDPVGMTHLPRSLLYHGRTLTVVSPATLRQAVAELARSLATHHADGE